MSRQAISYPAKSSSLLASHFNSVSFDNPVFTIKFFGGAGASARAASARSTQITMTAAPSMAIRLRTSRCHARRCRRTTTGVTPTIRIAVAVATTIYEWRFGIPGLGAIAAAGALGGWSLAQWLRDRRGSIVAVEARASS